MGIRQLQRSYNPVSFGPQLFKMCMIMCCTVTNVSGLEVYPGEMRCPFRILSKWKFFTVGELTSSVPFHHPMEMNIY